MQDIEETMPETVSGNISNQQSSKEEISENKGTITDMNDSKQKDIVVEDGEMSEEEDSGVKEDEMFEQNKTVSSGDLQ